MTILKIIVTAGMLTATTAGLAFANDAPSQKPERVSSAHLKKLNSRGAPSIQSLSPEMARKMLANAEKNVDLTAATARLVSASSARRVKPARATWAFLRQLNSSSAPSIQMLPPKTAHKMLTHAKGNVKVEPAEITIFNREIKKDGSAPINSANP